VLQRLLATFTLYVVLLFHAPAKPDPATRKTLAAMTGVVFVLLLLFNLNPLRDRSQDFLRRLPYTGRSYASFNPVATQRGVVSIDMVDGGYQAVALSSLQAVPMPASGDVLAIAGSQQSPFVYFELVTQRSQILRLAADEVGRPAAVPTYIADGQQPAISYDGRWLAFLRQDRGQYTVWLSHDGASPQPAAGWEHLHDVLEMTITSGGDIIAAVGGAANPHLAVLSHSSGDAHPVSEIAGTVRYPAISPDSTVLAFSRREAGSWHLFIRQLATGSEQQLTRSACNATSPAWQDANALLYATDCGRGLGLNALARINLRP
jgi:hypothetical protein